MELDNIKPTEPPAVPFWAENPNILLNLAHITELFPSSEMTYTQKLNAITRSVILLTLFMALQTHSMRAVVFGAISIGVIYLVYFYHMNEKEKAQKKKEAFIGLDWTPEQSGPAKVALEGTQMKSEVFDKPSDLNPFSNVLVTDISKGADKRPAPPAFNAQVNSNILDKARDLVIRANPGNSDVANRLFSDLGEQLTFEQSMRQFYSMPSTTTPDDQQAFAEFCYGGMISCAEGNKFACARNAAAMRHTLS